MRTRFRAQLVRKIVVGFSSLPIPSRFLTLLLATGHARITPDASKPTYTVNLIKRYSVYRWRTTIDMRKSVDPPKLWHSNDPYLGNDRCMDAKVAILLTRAGATAAHTCTTKHRFSSRRIQNSERQIRNLQQLSILFNIISRRAFFFSRGRKCESIRLQL
jgi:hypothetical protein